MRARPGEAAEWLVRELAGIGFEAGLRETPGQPAVVAHHPGPDGDAPRVLYYGHYDVQPAEPLDLWDSPPFEPAIVDGPAGKRIVARGAVDNKGQLMMFVEAFRAWKAVHGALPVGVTVFLEGEEESGSPSLDGFLEAHKHELQADVCIVSDTNMWDIDTPALGVMLRGLLYLELTLHGPSQDLHSGLYGGAVPNPLNILTRILGDLHDEQGRVQIPGFYDDLEDLGELEQAWQALDFDEASFLAHAGLQHPAGEAGFSTIARLWSRPTCDLNGIWGGYTGAGAKTVIPAKASAKLSCRLVPGQDAQKIKEGFRAFLDARLPGRLPLRPRRAGRRPSPQNLNEFAVSEGRRSRPRRRLRPRPDPGRHGRLDPGGRRDPRASRHRIHPDGLRPRRRSRARAQREVRAPMFPQRHESPRSAA